MVANALYVLLDNDYSIRVYQSFVVIAIFQKYFILRWHYA